MPGKHGAHEQYTKQVCLLNCTCPVQCRNVNCFEAAVMLYVSAFTVHVHLSIAAEVPVHASLYEVYCTDLRAAAYRQQCALCTALAAEAVAKQIIARCLLLFG